MRSSYGRVIPALLAATLLTMCVTVKRATLLPSQLQHPAPKLELTYWTKPREVFVGCFMDYLRLPTVPSVHTVLEVIHDETGHVWRCPYVAPRDWPYISFLPQCESDSDWQDGRGTYTVRVLPYGDKNAEETDCHFRYDDSSIKRIEVALRAPLDDGSEATCRIRRSRPAPDTVRLAAEPVSVSFFGPLEFPTFEIANASQSAIHSGRFNGGFWGDAEMLEAGAWRRVHVLSPVSGETVDQAEAIPVGARVRSLVDTSASESEGPGVAEGTYRYYVSFSDRELSNDRRGSWTDDVLEAEIVFHWPPLE